MDENEMMQEETFDTPCEKPKKPFTEKLGLTISGLMYGGLLGGIYWVLSLSISWLMPFSLFLPTIALILLAAIGLYLYSNKGKKYIFAWPAICFVTCILLAVFEKLAS